MRYEPIPPQLFIENRRRLASLLPANSVAVVNANDICPTNADGVQGTIVNSDLFYLTGVEQEQSILLLYPLADDEQHREILFLREPTAEAELWDGHKLTKPEARELTGIANIRWLAEFPRLFHRLACESSHIFLNSNEHKRAIIEVESRDARFIATTRQKYPLHSHGRLAPLMHRLRSVKSDSEIKLMRQACELTNQGFRRVLEFVKPGVNEWEVEAEFGHEFVRRGGRFAYLPIIASGLNACSLHYISNDHACRKDDLLLLDVGASYANYNSDLTRTIPVNGRFTPRQRAIYKSVLSVLRQCIASLTPGKKIKDWQIEAEQYMERELVNLGLISLKEIKAQDPDSPALKKYFMHGVGHPIGLDVHDVGITVEPLQPGWVMTVEPGIYLPEERFAVRLENNVLITQDRPVDLMADIPIEINEIEDLMAGNAKLYGQRNGNHGKNHHRRNAPTPQKSGRKKTNTVSVSV
jgi:Xaa-Pro aminopeptidase